MIVYGSITEHINKRMYPCTVPPHYGQIHSLVEDGVFAPFTNGNGWFEDENAQEYTRQPICNMIDMCATKTSFTICEDKDVVEILHYVDAYIEEAKFSAEHREDVRLYLKKVIFFRQKLYPLFRRVLNLHPDWREAYQGKSAMVQLMTELATRIGMNITTAEALEQERLNFVAGNGAPLMTENMTPDERLAALKRADQIIYDV